MRLGIFLELLIPPLFLWHSLTSVTLKSSNKIMSSNLLGSEGLASQSDHQAYSTSCSWCSQLLHRAYKDNSVLVDDFESFRSAAKKKNDLLHRRLRKLRNRYRLLNNAHKLLQYHIGNETDSLAVDIHKATSNKSLNTIRSDNATLLAEEDLPTCLDFVTRRGYICQVSNNTETSPNVADLIVLAARPRVDVVVDPCKSWTDKLTNTTLENTNLITQIESLRSQNNQLLNENQSLKNQTNEMTSQLSQCNSTLQQLTQELNDCQNTRSNFTATPVNLDQQSESSPINSSDPTSKQDTAHIEEPTTNHAQDLDSDLLQRINQLEADLLHCNDSKNSYTFFIAEINKELSKTRQENQNLTRELANLKKGLPTGSQAPVQSPIREE